MTQLINNKFNQQLSGKDAKFHYEQYAKLVDDEIAANRAKLRSGLAREQYDLTNKKIEALLAAKMILKTVQIFYAEQ